MRERSEALMPVLMPLAASTETVKAVEKLSRFCSTMALSPSSFARSPVSGAQMRPRPWVAMKLMICGVIFSAAQMRSPSFSRSSSSVTMTKRPFAYIGDDGFDGVELKGSV